MFRKEPLIGSECIDHFLRCERSIPRGWWSKGEATCPPAHSLGFMFLLSGSEVGLSITSRGTERSEVGFLVEWDVFQVRRRFSHVKLWPGDALKCEGERTRRVKWQKPVGSNKRLETDSTNLFFYFESKRFSTTVVCKRLINERSNILHLLCLLRLRQAFQLKLIKQMCIHYCYDWLSTRHKPLFQEHNWT